MKVGEGGHQLAPGVGKQDMGSCELRISKNLAKVCAARYTSYDILIAINAHWFVH